MSELCVYEQCHLPFPAETRMINKFNHSFISSWHISFACKIMKFKSNAVLNNTQ